MQGPLQACRFDVGSSNLISFLQVRTTVEYFSCMKNNSQDQYEVRVQFVRDPHQSLQ